MKNVRMSDVAKAAGVSLATVGRVLHQSGYVEEKTREHVERAIQTLGYVPNQIARNLKNKNSTLIGHLVVLNPNMLFHKISMAINAAAEKAGYRVLTLTAPIDAGEEGGVVDEFISQNVAGIIITSNASIKDEVLQKLLNKEIPIVMIERTRVMPKIDRVTVDDCGGVYQAVEALIGKNKKRIAYIGSAPLGSVEAERLIGYQKAMRAHSLPCDLIYAEGGYTNRDGYLGAQTILARCKETDAFFCASDILASGVLQYLYQKKIRVPEDLSVTGYDDTIATLLSPPISSVALSLETLGKSAVQLLLARVEDYEKEDEEIRTETIYIERDT